MSKNKILFVCLGNICRSPMGEGVMKHLVTEQKRSNDFFIDSAGTAAYHIGKSPDTRMIATAHKHGITLDSKARQFKPADFDAFDYIFVMDKSNYNNVIELIRSEEDKEKVIMMRSFDDEIYRNEDVPDPYYGGDAGFENVYQILLRSCTRALNKLF